MDKELYLLQSYSKEVLRGGNVCKGHMYVLGATVRSEIENILTQYLRSLEFRYHVFKTC